MNRRGFFRVLAAAPIAAVLAPDIAELLAPTRTIFLPPRGGWLSAWDGTFSNLLAPAVDLRQESLEKLLMDLIAIQHVPYSIWPSKILPYPLVRR